MFVMAGDARADREICAAIHEELGDFRVHAFEMSQGMEDRRLTADAGRVDVGPRVDVGAAIEEQTRRVEEAVFRGDVEECCAPEGEQAAARGTAIELGVAAVEKRRVGIEESREFGVATAQDRQHAGKIVTRVRSGGEQCLNAGRVKLRIARVCAKDVVQRGGVRIVGNAAIRIGAMVEQPLQGLRLEVLARIEEKRKPAHAEPVDVGSIPKEQLHHRNPAGPGRHDAFFVAHELTQGRAGCQEFFDAQHVIACDGMFQLASLFKRLDVLLEFRPARKAVLSGDLKLRISERRGRACADEIFRLVAEMTEVRTIWKLHERNPFHARCPHESGERRFASGEE